MNGDRVDVDGVPQAAAAALAPAFDREWSVEDLLPPAERDKLIAALAAAVGAPVALVSRHGAVLAGSTASEGAAKVGVTLDLEPLAWLLGPAADAERLRGAALLLRAVLQARLRYRMASDLHVESVQADYEALKAKHAAVQASEAQYKALAAELEDRVRAQVKIIDERQRQLYQVERLASVGQLAAGVAHEINNPIGFARSNLATAQKYVEKFARIDAMIKAGAEGPAGGPIAGAWRDDDLSFVIEDFADLLKDSIGGIDRVARIVADLKGFSNVDRPEEAVVDLNRNLEDVCNMAATQFPEGVHLRREFGPLPPLLCLPGHINQVLLNVLNNAAQAVGAAGTITVRSRSEARDGQAGVLVTISDDGCGIAADVLPRVFDPFFTTRPVGHGTGLGLALARDIVLAHDGRIDIASELGAGTTVTLWLPT